MAIDWDDAVLGPVMAVFGAEATIRPRGGTVFDLTDAVFDAEYSYVERDDRTGAEVTTTTPMVGVRAAACPVMPKQSDQVDIPGGRSPGRYVIKDVREDSHGHLVLLLNFKGAL